MSELKEMFNGCVLMNDAAIENPAIMNVMQSLSDEDFEFKNVSSDHVTFEELISFEELEEYKH